MFLGSKSHRKAAKDEEIEVGKHARMGTGGVHNPSNRLPAGKWHHPRKLLIGDCADTHILMRFLLLFPLDDPVAMIPVVQRSVGSAAGHVTPVPFLITLVSLIFLLLH